MPIKKRRRNDISDIDTERVEKKVKRCLDLKVPIKKKLLHVLNNRIPSDALKNPPLSKEEKKNLQKKGKVS